MDRRGIIILQGRPYVVLGTVATDPPQSLVIDARSGHPVLSVDPSEGLGLPTEAGLAELALCPASSASVLDGEEAAIRRMRFELEILDAARVPNGTKAIWLWLNSNWSEDLRQRFGDFDDPATIKRWRTALRRAATRDDGEVS